MERTRRGYLAATAGLAGLFSGCLGGSGGSGGGGGGGGSGGGGGTEDCDIGDEPTVADLPAPALGSDDADVTVVAFEDFSCPHCATFSLEVLPELRSAYVEPGVIRFEHHDFPIPVDERWSWQAASAARGVQEEVGDDAFFDYAHSLFENQSDFSPRLITDLANDVDAPGCAIQADALNETYRPVLEADRQSGVDSGVEGTPGVFVAGQQVDPTYDAIAAAIEAER